jgi:hypothetical protein
MVFMNLENREKKERKKADMAVCTNRVDRFQAVSSTTGRPTATSHFCGVPAVVGTEWMIQTATGTGTVPALLRDSN